MVDVDHSLVPALDDARRQHQHVSRKNHEVWLNLIKKLCECRLLSGSCIRGITNGQVIKANTEEPCQFAGIGMIRHHGLHIKREMTQVGATQQVHCTVQRFRHKYCGAWAVRSHAESIRELKMFGDGVEGLLELVNRVTGRNLEFHSLEEHCVMRVGVLLGINDVAAH